MSDDANSQQSAGDELARRQAALRALAQSAPQQPASAASPAPTAAQRSAATARPTRTAAAPGFAALVTGRRAPGKRRGVVVGVSLALIVVVVVVGVIGVRAYLAQRAAAQPKPVLRINPLGNDNLGCLSAVVWSPDGSQVAAMGGLQGNCGGASADSPTDAIFIYSADSGKLMAQLQPDRAILDSAAYHQFAGQYASAITNGSGVTTISVQGLTWTHDQQALVMSYVAMIEFPEGQNGATPSVNGVMRMGIRDSTLTKLWTNPASNTIANGMLPRWDLTAGTLSSVAPPTAGATLYRWGSDGVLVADGSAAGKPIGSPGSGQPFSIWQPGALGMAFNSPGPNAPPQAIPQDIEFGANFTALSPDGRYFYQYVPAYGSLVPPSTQRAFAQEPRIEPHDPALLALAKRLAATPLTSRQPVQYMLAWRPDGRLLASVTQNADGAKTTPDFTVTLYDSRTGQVVKRLTPNFSGLQSGDSGNELLSWSPDGTRLLLADNVYGAITIWGPGALPA